jgi:hypothetical protein
VVGEREREEIEDGWGVDGWMGWDGRRFRTLTLQPTLSHTLTHTSTRQECSDPGCGEFLCLSSHDRRKDHPSFSTSHPSSHLSLSHLPPHLSPTQTRHRQRRRRPQRQWGRQIQARVVWCVDCFCVHFLATHPLPAPLHPRLSLSLSRTQKPLHFQPPPFLQPCPATWATPRCSTRSSTPTRTGSSWSSATTPSVSLFSIH